MSNKATLRPNGLSVLLLDYTLAIIGCGSLEQILRLAKQAGLEIDQESYNKIAAPAKVVADRS